MLAITCDKCRRRYSATDEELRVYLQQAEGKKYAQVLCPHCGKASKVAADRIHQALRFSPSPEVEARAPAEDAAGNTAGPATDEASTGGSVGQGTPPEEVNPVA
jgi:type II secretory ATPase GspE/PulE/Tfp pilus assembly ATPase PilB-like protein